MRVAHYPPSTSKDNPIEHRLCPPLQRACQGVLFTRIDLVQARMAKATTHTGGQVSVNMLNTIDPTGRKVTAEVNERLRVVFDDEFPQWNDRILSGDSRIGESI